MSSAFDQQFADPRTFLLQQHGQGASYTPRGGDAIATTVMGGSEAAHLMEVPGERTLYRHCTFEVLTADVVMPGRGDTIQIDGETDVWTVHERLGVNGGLCGVLAVIPARQPTEGRKV